MFQIFSILAVINHNQKQFMETITADIKPGPKPKKQDGTPDERRRVNPENQPKHPKLKPHDHDKNK